MRVSPVLQAREEEPCNTWASRGIPARCNGAHMTSRKTGDTEKTQKNLWR